MKYLIHYKFIQDSQTKDDVEIWTVPEYQSDIMETDLFELAHKYHEDRNKEYITGPKRVRYDELTNRKYMGTSGLSDWEENELREYDAAIITNVIVVNFTRIPE